MVTLRFHGYRLELHHFFLHHVYLLAQPGAFALGIVPLLAHRFIVSLQLSYARCQMLCLLLCHLVSSGCLSQLVVVEFNISHQASSFAFVVPNFLLQLQVVLVCLL
jgi:hypothetical protein